MTTERKRQLLYCLCFAVCIILLSLIAEALP